jgi:hypothetical protein
MCAHSSGRMAVSLHRLVDVVRSPYGRIDSDCWDVLLKFFDPGNTHRAYLVLRFALDVSDKTPVRLGRLVDYISTI